MIDMTNQMVNRIKNLNVENERISYQMSTGEVIENGSDDSVLYAKVIDIGDSLRVYDGLKTQIDKTTAQNNVADSSISEIKLSLDQIKSNLLKSLNAGMDDAARSALATNITGLKENIFTISNTRVDGEYIFSGSNTTKQTFVKDPDYDANGKITYGGNGILRNVAVEPNVYRDRGITAFDVTMYNANTAGDGEQLTFYEDERIIDDNGYEWKFNSDKDTIFKYDRNGNITDDSISITKISDATTTKPAQYQTDDGEITGTTFLQAKHNYFDDLNIAINALKGYATNADGTKGATITSDEADELLQHVLDTTSQQYDATNVGHAELGGRNNIFNIAAERIQSKQTHYNILLQKTNGADLSKLAMESKSLEMTYQALYSTVAKMNDLSLLNYLK